jgi:hypothetical protein
MGACLGSGNANVVKPVDLSKSPHGKKSPRPAAAAATASSASKSPRSPRHMPAAKLPHEVEQDEIESALQSLETEQREFDYLCKVTQCTRPRSPCL